MTSWIVTMHSCIMLIVRHHHAIRHGVIAIVGVTLRERAVHVHIMISMLHHLPCGHLMGTAFFFGHPMIFVVLGVVKDAMAIKIGSRELLALRMTSWIVT